MGTKQIMPNRNENTTQNTQKLATPTNSGIIKAPFYFMQTHTEQIKYTDPSFELTIENADNVGYDYIMELEGEMEFRVMVNHTAEDEHKYLPSASSFRITRAQPTANIERGYYECVDEADKTQDYSDASNDAYVYTSANLSDPKNQVLYNLLTGAKFSGITEPQRTEIPLQVISDDGNIDMNNVASDVKNSRWVTLHGDDDKKNVLQTSQYRGSKYNDDRKRVGQKINTPIDVDENKYIDRDGQFWSGDTETGGRQIIVHYEQMAAVFTSDYAIKFDSTGTHYTGSDKKIEIINKERKLIQNTTQALIFEDNNSLLTFTPSVPKKENLTFDSASEESGAISSKSKE